MFQVEKKMAIDPKKFFELILFKKRPLVFTKHALLKLEKRFMDEAICEKELTTLAPIHVEEQACDAQGERLFDAYYFQKDEKFHRYVIVINEVIRVVTMMRISRDLQKRWGLHAKN